MFCSKCGTEIQDGMKFCPKCGAQLVFRKAAEQGDEDAQKELESDNDDE